MQLSRERDRLEAGRQSSNAGMNTTSLVGMWLNFDPNAEGITRANIRPHGESLLLSVEEKGHLRVQQWPAVVATPLGAAVDDDRAVGFFAHCEPIGPSDARVAALYGYLNRGLLTIDMHLRFPDDEEKPLMTRSHYYRPEAPG